MKSKSRTILTRPSLVIIIAYLIVGALYAWYTPIWQAPDEPAHYNYIRTLASGEGFPVMESGDYNQQLLQRLTAERFPREVSIELLEYEDHQPPLYYLFATPIFWLSNGSVFALRLFSLLLGAVGVMMLLDILQFFFPETPYLVWLGGGNGGVRSAVSVDHGVRQQRRADLRPSLAVAVAGVEISAGERLTLDVGSGSGCAAGHQDHGLRRADPDAACRPPPAAADGTPVALGGP